MVRIETSRPVENLEAAMNVLKKALERGRAVRLGKWDQPINPATQRVGDREVPSASPYQTALLAFYRNLGLVDGGVACLEAVLDRGEYASEFDAEHFVGRALTAQEIPEFIDSTDTSWAECQDLLALSQLVRLPTTGFLRRVAWASRDLTNDQPTCVITSISSPGKSLDVNHSLTQGRVWFGREQALAVLSGRPALKITGLGFSRDGNLRYLNAINLGLKGSASKKLDRIVFNETNAFVVWKEGPQIQLESGNVLAVQLTAAHPPVEPASITGVSF